MRTLSARIVLGFAVLIVAFAIIVGTLGRNTSDVESEAEVISHGYLPLALDTQDVVLKQETLINYLSQGLPDEPAGRFARPRIKAAFGLRAAALTTVTKDMASVRDELVTVHPDAARLIDVQLAALRATATNSEPLYVAMMLKPPAGSAAAADPTLAQVIANEQHFQTHAIELNGLVRERVVTTTSYLRDNEHTVRQRTLYLGIVAVMLGLMIAAWAVINLRPLTRLRAAARQVGGGDYKTRIPEIGPAEVADLARELNSMSGAIEERERELVRSERLAAVGKMAAMITHEVRNPLSSIGLNTELLEDHIPPDADEARALCRAITHEVDRLTAITEEYLAFARLPKPKIAAEKINALVGALAQFVREDLAARKVELVVEPGAGDPVALVDQAQLRQCLINLVRNAADAVVTNGGGHIWLRTRAAGGRVAIEVADDGTGIAEELIPKLFEDFFSTKDGGSGLGLALTQQIVKDHGGELAVTSAVGRGTTFTVTVPAAV